MPIIRDTFSNEKGEEVTIFIEVDDLQPVIYDPYQDVRGEENKALVVARDVFESGMNLIRNCAEQVIQTIHKVDAKVRPTEFEMQLAIKLDSTVGAILAKASAEAQLQVTMKWVKQEKER